MSVENQKLSYIDRTTPKDSDYIKLDSKTYFDAARRLTPAGLSVYMYFFTVVPDTWDGNINQKNTREHPFELSSSAIAEKIQKDTRTVQRGINDLIEKGYLVLYKGNRYRFRDILPEDKVLNKEEATEFISYKDELEKIRALRKDEITETIKNKATYNWLTPEELVHENKLRRAAGLEEL